MIDTAVKVVDRLISLLREREKRIDAYFDEFIEPIYSDISLVVEDYFSLFHQLVEKLENEEDVEVVIKWLEERRYEYLPLSIKVRGMMKSYPRTKQYENTLEKFEAGVWGVMKGGLSLFEEGYTPMPEYGWHDHTVLDLLYLWHHRPISSEREHYIHNAKKQREALQNAWKDVTEAYSQLKTMKFESKNV